MASNGCTALRHGDSCHGVIGLPARVCCEAVLVAKNKLPTADLSATPSQPRRGEQNRAEWRLKYTSIMVVPFLGLDFTLLFGKLCLSENCLWLFLFVLTSWRVRL